MLRPVEAIDTELRQLFARVLQRHASAVYRSVFVERDRRDMLNIRAEFRLGREARAERFSAEVRIEFPRHLESEWRRVKSQTAGRVSYDADVLWSETVENHRVERELFRVRDALEHAQRMGITGAEVNALQEMYAERRNTYIQNHHVRQRPPETFYIDGPIGPRRERNHYDLYQYDIDRTLMSQTRTETATEVQQRVAQHQAAYEQRYIQQQVDQQGAENTLRQQQLMEFVTLMQTPVMRGALNFDGLLRSLGFGDFDPGAGSGGAEAQERALQLLKENLTPAQRAQYEKSKHFDVKGGETGRTYRINHGRQQNIHQLDAKGAPVQGWCFLPAGNLVEGDVMLAQKNALELFEMDALRIANPFPVRRAGSGTWGDYYQSDFGSFTRMSMQEIAEPRDDRADAMRYYGLGLVQGRGIVRGGDGTA